MTSLIFLRLDREHDYARSEVGQFLTGFGDRLFELVDDEQARLLGFRHRFAHDRDRDAGRP